MRLPSFKVLGLGLSAFMGKALEFLMSEVWTLRTWEFNLIGLWDSLGPWG